MKLVIAYLFLIGLAVAQDTPDEVVTEAPQPVEVEESTAEPAVTDLSPSDELITSSADESATTVDGDLLDLKDPENSTLLLTTNECAELNRRRNSLLECCEYPHVKYYDIFAKYCVDECVGVKDVCCSQICVWRKTKIINEEGTVNIEGFKETLMSTVMNKAEWEELVDKSVAACHEEYTQSKDVDNYCRLPTRIVEMATCTMKKLYLECPTMAKSGECDATKKYVEDCM